MGTFSAFTCEPPLAALSEWDRAFLRAHRARGGGRLAGLGSGASNQQAIDCWNEEAQEFLRDNSDISTLKWTKGVAGTDADQWIGTLICPKPDPWGRHMLLDVRLMWTVLAPPSGKFTGKVDQTNAPEDVVLTAAGIKHGSIGRVEGRGYFETIGAAQDHELTDFGAPGGMEWDSFATIYDPEKKGLIRGHTATGVAHKGVGIGAALYAGMALSAIHWGFTGVYSITGTRSIEAELLWHSARQPKTGPLANGMNAAMARDYDGGMIHSHRADVGDQYHCLYHKIEFDPPMDACGKRVPRCTDDDPTEVTGGINVDYINAEGLKRWGLVVFSGPRLSRDTVEMRRTSRTVSSAWTTADITKAFGPADTRRDEASDATAHLSNNGYELLARAHVGDSAPLAVAVAGVLAGSSKDLARRFLMREDVIALLSRTAGGRKLVQNAGAGTKLAGLGRAAFRDVETAMYRPANPLALTLPPLSRAAQSFVNSYPGD